MQRQTQLANDIWPLLLPRIQAMITASASGSGTGSGGGAVNLATHDLGGSQHKGTLRSDQAPQFLMLDGSRPLAGSLAVDSGVTIDGVDISAHAADINAHHAKLHAITDAANHTVTGSQYQIVGLTAVNTLGLLTPSASPAANAVVKTDGASGVTLVDLTVTSDLFMTGYLDFGTDVMYEDASYLQVTGSKAVRFGQNIGNANWTVYSAGGASFGGNVDIVSGGDLTVGSNVLFVDNSANSVGIGGVPVPTPAIWPDPQFALDINGPARATYWIGPHAIQLKNVLLLSHFDGRYPYSSNFSGEPNGHMGQVATVIGDVIYRYGRYYKAGQFAAANTNLITNPRPDPGGSASNWNYNAGTAPVNAVSTNMPEGAVGERVIYYANHQFGWPNTTSVTNAGVYYLTGWIIASTSGTVNFYLQRNSGAFDTISNTVGLAVTANTWTRFTVGLTATATATARVVFSGYGANVSVCNWQFESANCTPYHDGGLTLASTWTGTAHASTSTRTAAYLTYPTSGNMTTGAFTAMAWVNVEVVPSTNQTIWRIDGSTSGYIWLRLVAGKPEALRGNVTTAQAASAITARTWTHIAMTWDGTSTRLYVNGVLADTDTPGGGFSGMPSIMYVGAAAGATEMLNGLIDDLCILDRVMPGDEIRSVYESNAPVFAETSTFSFRPTPKGLIWADDEGLWMRDTAGKPVLGVYGGEAATKNWGGFNLVPGDLLLGNNAVGSSAIWWSRVSGTFGFYGAGSGTPQVEISTDGRLTAGAGKVALDSTGFHAYNAATNLAIDINSEGIYMRDGGPRTTITSWASGSRIRWGALGEIYGADPESYLDDSSISRTLYPTVIRAIRQGNDAALIELAAVRSDTGAGAKIIIGEGFRLKGYFSGSGNSYATNRVVHAIADDVILESTNLQWLGQTTSASAVGTYAGKIKIRINGTDRYIPYYAS